MADYLKYVSSESYQSTKLNASLHQLQDTNGLAEKDKMFINFKKRVALEPEQVKTILYVHIYILSNTNHKYFIIGIVQCTGYVVHVCTHISTIKITCKLINTLLYRGTPMYVVHLLLIM